MCPLSIYSCVCVLLTRYLVRGLLGNCDAFHPACLQSAGYVHVIWKKDKQSVAQIRRQTENVSAVYHNRASVFPSGSLNLCLVQMERWRESTWQKDVIRMACICVKLLTWNWAVSLSVLCVFDNIFSIYALALIAHLTLSLGYKTIREVFSRKMYVLKEWSIWKNIFFFSFLPFYSLSVAAWYDSRLNVWLVWEQQSKEMHFYGKSGKHHLDGTCYSTRFLFPEPVFKGF